VDSAHHPLSLPVIADRMAQRLDSARERGLAHEAASPHGVEDLFLGDQTRPLTHEQHQYVENLGLDPAHSPTTAELVPTKVELAVTERVDHRLGLH
jgi:hypothetical protein